MTFEDALQQKESYPSNFRSERDKPVIFIVAPKNNPFMMNWLKDFNSSFTDETAKKYSQDNDYWVYWKELF